MPDFTRRSYEKELLDRDDIPFDAIRKNMEELEFINSWLGGHKITIDGLKKILACRGIAQHSDNAMLICEIGCGGGDNLKAIARWCAKRKLNVRFIGIDINPECIAYAKINCQGLEVDWICSDYKKAHFSNQPHIIFSSLFCHHFDDTEMINQLKWLDKNSETGFFINDLHRNWLAYHSIRILTRLFSGSYLVKNDAPLSVTRGFSRTELNHLCASAAVKDFSLEWKWAFRWLLVRCKPINENV